MISALNIPLFFLYGMFIADSFLMTSESIASFRLLLCNSVVVVAVAFICFAAGVV